MPYAESIGHFGNLKRMAACLCGSAVGRFGCSSLGRGGLSLYGLSCGGFRRCACRCRGFGYGLLGRRRPLPGSCLGAGCCRGLGGSYRRRGGSFSGLVLLGGLAGRLGCLLVLLTTMRYQLTGQALECFAHFPVRRGLFLAGRTHMGLQQRAEFSHEAFLGLGAAATLSCFPCALVTCLVS